MMEVKEKELELNAEIENSDILDGEDNTPVVKDVDFTETKKLDIDGEIDIGNLPEDDHIVNAEEIINIAGKGKQCDTKAEEETEVVERELDLNLKIETGNTLDGGDIIPLEKNVDTKEVKQLDKNTEINIDNIPEDEPIVNVGEIIKIEGKEKQYDTKAEEEKELNLNVKIDIDDTLDGGDTVPVEKNVYTKAVNQVYKDAEIDIGNIPQDDHIVDSVEIINIEREGKLHDTKTEDEIEIVEEVFQENSKNCMNESETFKSLSSSVKRILSKTSKASSSGSIEIILSGCDEGKSLESPSEGNQDVDTFSCSEDKKICTKDANQGNSEIHSRKLTDLRKGDDETRELKVERPVCSIHAEDKLSLQDEKRIKGCKDRIDCPISSSHLGVSTSHPRERKGSNYIWRLLALVILFLLLFFSFYHSYQKTVVVTEHMGVTNHTNVTEKVIPHNQQPSDSVTSLQKKSHSAFFGSILRKLPKKKAEF